MGWMQNVLPNEMTAEESQEQIRRLLQDFDKENEDNIHKIEEALQNLKLNQEEKFVDFMWELLDNPHDDVQMLAVTELTSSDNLWSIRRPGAIKKLINHMQNSTNPNFISKGIHVLDGNTRFFF